MLFLLWFSSYSYSSFSSKLVSFRLLKLLLLFQPALLGRLVLPMPLLLLLLLEYLEMVDAVSEVGQELPVYLKYDFARD